MLAVGSVTLGQVVGELAVGSAVWGGTARSLGKVCATFVSGFGDAPFEC